MPESHCYWCKSPQYTNGGLGPWIAQEIYVGIHAGIKKAGREAGHTKQFMKAKVRSQGGIWGRFQEVELASRLFSGIGYYLVSQGSEEEL